MPIRLHSEKHPKLLGTFGSLMLVTLVAACGSGGDASNLTEGSLGATTEIATESAPESAPDVSAEFPTIPPISAPSGIPINTDEPIDVDPEQTDLFDNAETTPIGDENAADIEQILTGTGSLIANIFASETDVDPAFAQSGAALVRELDASLILPTDIEINFADCGTANAFFIPAGFIDPDGDGTANSAIFMCHELTLFFSAFFGDPDQTFAASAFVLMHEIGHAFVEDLSLPVLGIEESYVDGIAAVLLGESNMAEGSALAGWFFGSQPDTPFSDSHRANPQRLGDLVCWGVGSDPSLLEKPIINTIFEQLVVGGRNCVAEYQQQVDGLTNVLGPFIQGGLSGALVATSE